MHDAFGQALNKGDVIMVPMRILDVGGDQDYCNVTVRTIIPMPGNQTDSTLTVNTKQIIRANPGDDPRIRLVGERGVARAEARTPEQLARAFHETYERLAPTFGYATRADTKQFDPNSANGKLMQAVCAEVVGVKPPEGGGGGADPAPRRTRADADDHGGVET